MGYLGTPAAVGFSKTTKDRFSGDNSTTGFTMSKIAGTGTDIQVFVDNIRQEPTTAYSVSGTTLTFTEAPPTGTNNVYVIHQHQALGTGPLPPQDLGTTDYIFGDDVSFQSDSAKINFGADSEVNLTHVHNTGLLLNSTNQLQFGDSGTHISQSADGVLDLVSDTELELNATTIDINGAVDVSGVLTANAGLKADNITIDGTEIDLSSGDLTLDVAGDIILDADGGDVKINDGGTARFHILTSASETALFNQTQDGDIVFKGDDGGSAIEAMKIDISAAGQVQFRDGTAALPAISFIDDVDTGLATLSDNTLSVTLEGAERVRFIQTNGETVFGVDSGSATAGGKITVYHSTSGRSLVNAEHDRSGADTNGYPYGIISNFPNNSSANFHTFEGRGGGALTFRVNSNGNVQNVNNSYGAISDVNLKENIEDASSQWDDIKAVKVRKFSWKSDKKDKADMLGVIAQELETAGMGGLVNEHPDTIQKEDGSYEQTGTSHKSVKYSILYMKAIKALQETMTKVEKLETVAKSKGWDLS